MDLNIYLNIIHKLLKSILVNKLKLLLNTYLIGGNNIQETGVQILAEYFRFIPNLSALYSRGKDWLTLTYEAYGTVSPFL